MHRVTESLCTHPASQAAVLTGHLYLLPITMPFIVPHGIQGWGTHPWRVSLYCLLHPLAEDEEQKSLYTLHPSIKVRGPTHPFAVYQLQPQLTHRRLALITQKAAIIHRHPLKTPCSAPLHGWWSSQHCGTHFNHRRGFLHLFSRLLGTHLWLVRKWFWWTTGELKN